MENEIIQQLDVIAKNIQALAQPKFIEYIALGISFISVLVSGIAILFAVRVSNKQNKINLFEKRYKIYDEIQRCNNFSNIIELAKEKEDIKILFLSAFNENVLFNETKLNENDNIYINKQINVRLDNLINALEQSEFLFKESPYIYEHIRKICKNLLILTYSSEINDKPFEKQKEEFKKLMNCEMYDKIISTMKKELNLSK